MGPTPAAGRFALSARCGSVAQLHAALPDPAGRVASVVVSSPTDRAVVLGSAQGESVLDEEAVTAAGYSLVRRRSGGGAVLVEPGALVWVDVHVPVGDPLWSEDVGTAFLWLGAAWARALEALLPSGTPVELRTGPPERSAAGRLFCYAALGTGEVTVAGRKVVGISQRRDRRGAWFQSMAALREVQWRLAGFLAAPAPDRRRALALLRARAGAARVDRGELVSRLALEIERVAPPGRSC